MTASAFSTHGLLLHGTIINWARIGSFIWINPLRSPMSIFTKSPDLVKCEAGAKE